MAGIIGEIKETKVFNVTCPNCGKIVEMEYNPSIGEIYNETRMGGNTIHMRSEISFSAVTLRLIFRKRR